MRWSFFLKLLPPAQVHCESCQTSLTELFSKIVKNEKLFTAFVKSSILNVWDSEFAYADRNNLRKKLHLRCASEYASELAFEVNDTHHRERLVFQSFQYWNGWLAASDLFHMFTQAIKFYTFHYQYRCLKNVLHQIDSKNWWLLLSSSLRQNLG